MSHKEAKRQRKEGPPEDVQIIINMGQTTPGKGKTKGMTPAVARDLEIAAPPLKTKNADEKISVELYGISGGEAGKLFLIDSK